VDRTPTGISITTQYATAVFDGKNVTSRPPKTEMWAMLYAQVKQADGRQYRILPYLTARSCPGGLLRRLLTPLAAPETAAAAWQSSI
jgi:hypothetical protein